VKAVSWVKGSWVRRVDADYCLEERMQPIERGLCFVDCKAKWMSVLMVRLDAGKRV
jgi:hypothetical protein